MDRRDRCDLTRGQVGFDDPGNGPFDLIWAYRANCVEKAAT
jgi:hypothetical protein